jgi:hypothetical protein
VSGLLTHAPSDVLASLLVALGVGSAHDAGAAWPVRCEEEVADPEDVITVFDTAGIDDGRTAHGDRVERHGVQARVRSGDFAAGSAKANAIAIAMDGVHWREVPHLGEVYLVHTITRTGPPLRLGKERDSSRRLWTVNALISLRQLD